VNPNGESILTEGSTDQKFLNQHAAELLWEKLRERDGLMNVVQFLLYASWKFPSDWWKSSMLVWFIVSVKFES